MSGGLSALAITVSSHLCDVMDNLDGLQMGVDDQEAQ